MLAGLSRALAAIAALGLTGAAAVVAAGAFDAPAELAEPPAVAVAASAETVLLASGIDHVLTEAELDELSSIAAERSRSIERSEVATDQLEAMRSARGEAVVQASRDAERRALEEAIANASPRELGQMMAAERGWTGGEWSCLEQLWQRESNWQPTAENPSSGAYGIPQSLPGSKMATVADDWRTNPATQIAWGLGYIGDRYGSPCGAWGHSQSVGWY